MVKRRGFPLILALALLLGGCGGGTGDAEGDPAADVSAQEAALTVLSALGAERWETLSGENAEFYITELYNLPNDSWTDAAICQAGGAEAMEIAVIRLAEGADGEAALAGLETYRDGRVGDFTGYAPDQAEMAAQSRAVLYFPWAALLICGDPDGAEAALAGLLSGEIAPPEGGPGEGAEETEDGPGPFQAPNKEDMSLYDTTDMLTVWRGGEAELTGKEREILEAASAILAGLETEGMSDYDKELAAYGWLAGGVVYDQAHYDPVNGAPRDSYTPYGPLVDRKGVCLGFASAFQLLMDMWDVECLTVVGAAYQGREDHAWNMVRLEGDWYCVDVTWDQGSGDPRNWRYFNVTSRQMAMSDHQWDRGAVPEAVTEGRGRPGE